MKLKLTKYLPPGLIGGLPLRLRFDDRLRLRFDEELRLPERCFFVFDLKSVGSI